MEIRKLLIFTCLMFFSCNTAFAFKLTVQCPPQRYKISNVQDNYYFITGFTQVAWDKNIRKLSNHGRFLDPGKPKSLQLKTETLDVQMNNAGKAISLYCYLGNSEKRVAFTITDIVLKNIGISGHVQDCNNQNNTMVCEIIA